MDSPDSSIEDEEGNDDNYKSEKPDITVVASQSSRESNLSPFSQSNQININQSIHVSDIDGQDTSNLQAESLSKQISKSKISQEQAPNAASGSKAEDSEGLEAILEKILVTVDASTIEMLRSHSDGRKTLKNQNQNKLIV